MGCRVGLSFSHLRREGTITTWSRTGLTDVAHNHFVRLAFSHCCCQETMASAIDEDRPWIRGVNLGGWLLLERFIVPYMFATTTCHLRGDHCCYPGMLSANSTCELCDIDACPPARSIQEASQSLDYPLDEYALADAFLTANRNGGVYRNPHGIAIAETWLNQHFENFLNKKDLERLVDFGITHVRVPLPHWILGNVLDDEPWIVGNRYAAFQRMCKWARELNLQVWPDIHTAPGSQNGFDNSGQSLRQVSCHGWLNQPENVQRSLDVIRQITSRIVEDGLNDVVTGIGLLNEPFKDCEHYLYRSFLDDGLSIVRATMGEETAVYVGDMFLADEFNDGSWWLDPEKYKNTYLDSHYYHVFAENERELSPRQHIAHTCQKEWTDATSCCYQDTTRPWYSPWKGTNTAKSQGVQRLFGEWSVAYDILPTSQLNDVMEGIAATGMAPDFDRELTAEQMDFMKRYAEAQMVVYESIDTGTSVGWFYWTIKMEGGAFAEWDFLRGIDEGWIPELPGPTQPSEQAYGTCYDIIFKTSDDPKITSNVLPDPSDLPPGVWYGDDIDDDVVVSHGTTLLDNDGIHHAQRYPSEPSDHVFRWLIVFGGAALVVAMVRRHVRYLFDGRKTAGYTTITATP